MKSLGGKPEGARLERIKASPLWAGRQFRNVHPVIPGLRAECANAFAWRLSLRRRASNAAWTAAVDESARSLVETPRERAARHLAWSLHDTDRDRRRARAHRPGVGTARVAVALARVPGASSLCPFRYGRCRPSISSSCRTITMIIAMIQPFGYTGNGHPARPCDGRSVVWARPHRRVDCTEPARGCNTGITVTAAPSQHFSGRGLKSRNSTSWSSFVIHSQRHAVFFSGDTGLTTEYRAIRERLGPFDLVMLEVGAFHPAWRHPPDGIA